MLTLPCPVSTTDVLALSGKRYPILRRDAIEDGHFIYFRMGRLIYKGYTCKYQWHIQLVEYVKCSEQTIIDCYRKTVIPSPTKARSRKKMRHGKHSFDRLDSRQSFDEEPREYDNAMSRLNVLYSGKELRGQIAKFKREYSQDKETAMTQVETAIRNGEGNIRQPLKDNPSNRNDWSDKVTNVERPKARAQTRVSSDRYSQ